jgi:hypothetical protein
LLFITSPLFLICWSVVFLLLPVLDNIFDVSSLIAEVTPDITDGADDDDDDDDADDADDEI